MSSKIVASGFSNIVAIAHSSARDAAVIAERSGRLTLIDLLRTIDGQYESRPIGDGYNRPTHVAIDDSSGRLVVADADGLWLASFSNASRNAATAFAERPEDVRGLGILRNPGSPSSLAVLDGAPTPHLDRYDLAPVPGGAVAVIVPALVGATDTAIATDGGSAYFLTTGPAGTVLQLGDFSLATVRQVTPQPLPFGGRLVALDANWVIVAGRDAQLAAVSRDGVVRVVPGTTPPPSPVTSAVVTDSGLVLAAAGGDVLETAIPVGFTDPVLLTIDPAPLFIGGYAPVRVDTAGSGLTFDDVALSVKDPAFGAISPSRDDTFDPDAPHLLLAGGWKPGTGVAVAKQVSTGQVVGRATFEIADVWPDTKAGPTFCITGRCDAPVVRPAWGGGDAGPQKIDIFRAPATWRVAIVLLDTTSNLYPTTAAGLGPIRTDWNNAFAAGVTIGGISRSVVGYYSEVSYGKLTMSLVGNAIVGPVHAPGNWDAYFEVETQPDPANPGSTVPSRWNPKPDTWKAFASALELANEAAVADGNPPVVDLAQTDAVAFVVPTVNAPFAAAPPTSTSIGRFVWPQQLSPTVELKSGDRTLPMLMMPENWTAIDGRQIYETLAHELGHTLQLPDLYLYPWMNQGLDQRVLGDWDLMCNDGGLPQLSLPSRMALGWVPKGELRTYNFAANGGGAVLDSVTLHALERSAIPAAGLRGVEVRIAQGRNYYFEYRSRQGASLGDAGLPIGQVVVGTDVSSPKGGQNYDSRPMTLRLPDDPDGRDDTDSILTEGAFLSTGDDYRQKDFTDGAPKDFVATVTAVRPESADVQIRYNSEAKPELSIRTWPNGDKQWQSPDIQVRNAKSDADSRWLNVPWGGNPNRVVATVRNHGGLEAKDVRAFFSIKNLTTNAADKPPVVAEPLGMSAPVTIPAGQTRELTVDWVAPMSGHFCITVDIPLYEEPGDPAVHESSDRDNFAQSNYDKFWSESASPSERKRFTVRLENPTDAAAVVFPRVRQTSPFYRTYLEHSWLRLGPQESREIVVMTECLDGDPAWAGFIEEHRGEMWEVPNVLEISGWVRGVCVSHCVGGATVEVNSGRRTRIEDIEFFQEPGVSGTVLRPDGTPADHGTILVTALREGEDPSRQMVATSDVRQDGRFFTFVQGLEPGMVVQIFYLGGFGMAPCESALLRADF